MNDKTAIEVIHAAKTRSSSFLLAFVTDLTQDEAGEEKPSTGSP